MDKSRTSWRKLGTRLVYDNPWIRVEEDRVINPGGSESLYGKVSFKNRAVGILAIDDAGEIYLVGQHRYTLDEYSWELPMGGAPHGETALGAAQRELREETGLSARSWRELMRLHTSNCVTDEVGYVYLARGLSQGAAAPEPSEDLAIRRLPLEEAVAWVTSSRITDAISVAGILRLWMDRAQLL
ncbi:MAG TPA: NUDIX hydrolase [Gammaproteobacteria bacterium]|nr:NUDIX hydrolase [Gammaproteobacteria bacterium]